MNSKELTRIAVYCRVSTDSSDQLNSLESQKKYFSNYINSKSSWVLYDIYADEGLSGTSTKKRNAFNKMIADAMDNRFDCIITKEISRFARNTLDSIYYTRMLKEKGIGIIFANDNLFTLDPDAELRLTIMASIAQEESRKTSERVKWGQKRQMERGVVFGRNMNGYNIKNGEITIEPESAQTVQLIFHKYTTEHKGSTTIARELEEAGIPSFNNSGWTNTVILRILRNEKYCGDLVQKKTITTDYLTHKKICNHGEEELIVIKDHHEPIISRELFMQTQRELEARTGQNGSVKPSAKHCFSGKIICKECASKYVLRNKRLKNGNVYRYWQCYKKHLYGKEKGCSSSQISEKVLKELVMTSYSTVSTDRKRLEQIITKQLSKAFESTAIHPCDNNINTKQKTSMKKKTLIELYLDGKISRDNFIKAADELKKEYNNTTKQSTVKALNECITYAKDILNGRKISDEFIKNITDTIVIDKNRNITIKLSSLPCKWEFSRNISP